MILPKKTLRSERLEQTVRTLCTLVEAQIEKNSGWFSNEHSLRKELVACILGSQVRFEAATFALSRLEEEGLLHDGWWVRQESGGFEERVFRVLSQGYRFPKVRAYQLEKVRGRLASQSLTERMQATDDSRVLRRTLVQELPGLGPKQASMFLRNIGLSHDLAILDTHVLQFLEMQVRIRVKRARIGTMPGYEEVEEVAKDYAKSLGYPVGHLDWAIWATMKAAKELRL